MFLYQADGLVTVSAYCRLVHSGPSKGLKEQTLQPWHAAIRKPKPHPQEQEFSLLLSNPQDPVSLGCAVLCVCIFWMGLNHEQYKLVCAYYNTKKFSKQHISPSQCTESVPTTEPACIQHGTYPAMTGHAISCLLRRITTFTVILTNWQEMTAYSLLVKKC